MVGLVGGLVGEWVGELVGRWMSGCYCGGGSCLGLARHSFSLRFSDACPCDLAARRWTVMSKRLPCVEVNTQVFGRRFEGVVVASSLSSSSSLSLQSLSLLLSLLLLR